eukprot:gene26245-28698_t
MEFNPDDDLVVMRSFKNWDSRQPDDTVRVRRGREDCALFLQEKMVIDHNVKLATITQQAADWMINQARLDHILSEPDPYHPYYTALQTITYPEEDGKPLISPEDQLLFEKFRIGVHVASEGVFTNNIVQQALSVGLARASRTLVESSRNAMVTVGAGLSVDTVQYAKNVTAPEQKEHLLSYEEVVAIHTELVAAANRPTASHEDMFKGLTLYLVSGALGDALPPRRLKDYDDMKIRAYDTKSDSHIDGRGVAHFRAYKTVNTHGPQSIRLSPQLTKFLRKWTTQYNETVWLLVNAAANASALMHGVDCIDVLRSIYVSRVLAATPPERLEASAANMDTSKNMLMSVYSNEREKLL